MAHSEKILPTELNLDISPEYLGSDKARFIRNLDYSLYAGKQEGSNLMVYKPLQSAELYDPSFVLPEGRNFPVGKKVSRGTSEVYVFVWNSLGNHSIYRIRGGKCQFVYIGPELKFSLDPEHFVGEGRCSVFVVCRGRENLTYIVWTNSLNDQGFLCVEHSIGSAYFNQAKYNRLITNYPKDDLLKLGIRAMNDCIGIKEVVSDTQGLNKLKYKTWQFRISYIDVYGRPSEHGIISDLFFQSDCVGDMIQCLDLSFDAGNPLVDKIRIEFKPNCFTQEWQIHETINKYEQNDKPWYERKLSKKVSINADNIMTYRFCPGLQCIPIPPEETARVENPLALTSESVFALAGGLALAGNRYGRKPFSTELMDKVHFEVEKPLTDAGDAMIVTRNITVWAVIWNPYLTQVQAVWKKDDGNVFGGLASGGKREDRVGGIYGQHFGDPDQEGFIGYLAGTGQTTISRQHRYTGTFVFGIPTTPGDWTYFGPSLDINEVRNNYWLQKFEFKNVRPGIHVFRIAGHQASLKDSNYAQTSTYYGGHREVDAVNKLPNLGKDPSTAKELVINVCEKDYDSLKENTVVQLLDLTIPATDVNLSRSSRVSSGYVYETNDQGVGREPIAWANISVDISGDAELVYSMHTDYNGFYYSAAKDKDHEVYVHAARKCRREKIRVVNWDKSDSSGLKTVNYYATDHYADFQKEPCNRIKIKGRLIDCKTKAGLSGVTVGLTDGQFVTTNNNGDYELLTYDFERFNRDDYAVLVDNILFLAAGRCNLVTCEGKVCIPPQHIVRIACVNCGERVINIPDVQLRLSAVDLFGPQLGGKYGFGLKGADWMDRKNFIQTRKEWFLDIPTVNEMGVFAYPKIKYSIDPDARFDPWLDKLYFNWTKNLKYSDFHSWVVDRFELIDNTGNINTVSPTQLRVYYLSLNEYNKQHNFSTNSTWQIIDTNDQGPLNDPSHVNGLRVTDTVQFVANGDGKIYPTNITALLRFDKAGEYFQVDYDDKLKDIQEGALIKFMREKDCAETELFYEICQTIKILPDGRPEKNTGYLNIYDSYMVNRQIPTPIVTTKKVKQFVQGSDPQSYTVTDVDVTTNTLKNYGWPFEHHSPSDFWGAHCSNRGRVEVKNDLEDEVCKQGEIALSGVLGENGYTNFLHYFDNARVKNFDREWGAIVAGIAQLKTILLITDIDHCIVPFDDNAIRMGNDRIILVSADKQFGPPQRKAGQNWGCRKRDRNTIAFEDGVAHWLDSENSKMVFHNFATATDASKDKFESFLRPKIKYVQNNPSIFFHAHINPKDGKCYVTDFDINRPEYINNTLSPQITWNETLAIDAATQALRMFCSFTPEMYASLVGEESDKQFFSFKDALPYAHYRQKPASFNKFYGTQCQRSMRFAMATEPLQTKEYLSLEVHSDRVVMWSPEVVTEYGQLSMIPRNWFKRGNNFWIAPFLCDIKSVADKNKGKQLTSNVLFGGDKMRGKWVEVLLVGDPDALDKYSELVGITVNANAI